MNIAGHADTLAVWMNLQGHGSPQMATLQRSVAILWPVHIAFILGKVLLNRSIGMTDRFHSICPVHLHEHIICFMNSTTCRFTEPTFESTRGKVLCDLLGSLCSELQIGPNKTGTGSIASHFLL
jgi:hypothetical protein